MSLRIKTLGLINGMGVQESTPPKTGLAGEQPYQLTGKHQGTIIGDGNSVLKVGTIAPINGNRRPAVLEHPDVGTASIDHRFDGENHPSLQAGTLPCRPKIRDLRILMHAAPNA